MDMDHNNLNTCAREHMSFGKALEAMEQGHTVANLSWNGKGIFIGIMYPDKDGNLTHPFIYMDTTGLQTDNKLAPKVVIPWLASHMDMLSKDWVIVE